MKLTTPATASAPYTEEAPPVSTSTCLSIAAGMMLMSAAEPLVGDGSPGTSLRPFISVSVRVEPRPRRSTVAVPSAPLASEDAWLAATAGSELRTSSIRVVPCSFMSWLLTTATGDEASTSGRAIREPVTTMSASSPAAVVSALSASILSALIFCAAAGVAISARLRAIGATVVCNL